MDDMDYMTHAPWTEEQVERLRRFQDIGCVHPQRCDCGGIDGEGDPKMVPTTDGWVCPDHCGHIMKYVATFVLDGTMDEFFDSHEKMMKMIFDKWGRGTTFQTWMI